jgi:hypothetical protein
MLIHLPFLCCKTSKASKDYDKRKTDTELMDLAPAALVKLNSEKLMGDVSKLTIKEICALSFSFFGTLYKTKAVLVSGLEGRIGAQPGVLIAAAGAPAPAMIAFLMKRLLLRGRRATGRWEKERWGGARRSER